MRRLHVNLKENAYDICIGQGLLARAGELAKEVLRGSRVAVVTDETVGDLYGQRVCDQLREQGFTVSLIAIAPGEESKTVSTLETLYDAFMALPLTRSDGVLAMGGGVVGDLAGFAAATILRGVDFIQVPTTLLSQVDSSVGGKVAVNLKAGKNLAGAFYQPRLVLIDPECLVSLPDAVFSDGMAEVIKYGAIFDTVFFGELCTCENRSGVMKQIEDIVYHCCDLKRQVVVEDEHDHGRRQLLNFGHTLGHAYEAAYGYQAYTHGQAVAAGMCQMARMQVLAGELEPAVAQEIEALVRQYNLPTEILCSEQAYRDAILRDKKARDGGISLVLLKRLGEAHLKSMETEGFFSWLTQSLGEKNKGQGGAR